MQIASVRRIIPWGQFMPDPNIVPPDAQMTHGSDCAPRRTSPPAGRNSPAWPAMSATRSHGRTPSMLGDTWLMPFSCSGTATMTALHTHASPCKTQRSSRRHAVNSLLTMPTHSQHHQLYSPYHRSFLLARKCKRRRGSGRPRPTATHGRHCMDSKSCMHVVYSQGNACTPFSLIHGLHVWPKGK
jgi:hypothetical protein